MMAKKVAYVGMQFLADMAVGDVVLVELPGYNKVQSAKTTATIMKHLERGEWGIRLVTNKVIEITRRK